MEPFENPLPEIVASKHNGTLLYNAHGLRRMLERDIQIDQVIQALDSEAAEPLENYLQVGRPSAECLILGMDKNAKMLHVLVAYPIHEIITVYVPALPKWKSPRERNRQ